MINKYELLNNKDDLSSYSKQIECGDIPILVEWLNEKDDNIRYAAFLLLQILSEKDDRVYRHWETFVEKLNDDNSYQRSLGLMLISENIRWDIEDRFAKICTAYLEHCDDEKFITARQCIQGLNKIISQTKKYRKEIIERLTRLDFEKRKDTQKGLLLLDAVEVLGKLYQEEKDAEIESFLKLKYEQGNDKVKKVIKKLIS